MDLNRLSPGLLHAFLVVAEVGKISEAARQLHLSQPAVTAQIRRLVAELDTPLFIRSVHGVTLTPRGAHLQERLQRVFADLEGALSELDQPGELKGILKFAASTTSAAHFVPNIFARFRRHHPEVGLNLVVGNAKDVLELVREQHVGLGLLGGHERSPGVRFEQFMPDEIVAVCEFTFLFIFLVTVSTSQNLCFVISFTLFYLQVRVCLILVGFVLVCCDEYKLASNSRRRIAVDLGMVLCSNGTRLISRTPIGPFLFLSFPLH